MSLFQAIEERYTEAAAERGEAARSEYRRLVLLSVERDLTPAEIDTLQIAAVELKIPPMRLDEDGRAAKRLPVLEARADELAVAAADAERGLEDLRKKELAARLAWQALRDEVTRRELVINKSGMARATVATHKQVHSHLFSE